MGTAHEVKNDVKQASEDIKETAQDAASSDVVEKLTRFGFGVRGFIYIMMGFFALNAAFGNSGSPEDPQGTITALFSRSGGTLFLWVTIIGLLSYALWGLIRAVIDPLHKGTGFKGIIYRIAYLVSAVYYVLLALIPYGIVNGNSSASQGSGDSQDFLAMMMSKSWGPVGIAVLALIVGITGILQIYQGFSATFDKQFASYEMPPGVHRWAIILGRIGTAVRGFILLLIGGALGLAVLNSDPNQKIGMDSALIALKAQPYGIYLLGIVALGLVAFGFFSLMSTVYFRKEQPKSS